MEAAKDYLIPAAKWWEAQKKAIEIQRQYGIGVDPALLLTTPDPVLIVGGFSRNLMQVSGLDRFISRPVGFKAGTSYLEVRYPNGIKSYIKIQGQTPEERLKWAVKVSRSWHYVHLNGSGRWTVKEVYDLTSDTEAAKRAVNELGTRAAVAAALGLKPEVIDKYWHRATPLISRGHLIEISQPGTGKTTYAWYLSRVLGGTVVNESPTPAYLVGDARDGSFGTVFTSNIVVFDEIDKWHGDKLKQVYDVMLSGLENCVWGRSAGKGIQVTKCISAVFLGNTAPEEKSRMGVVKLLSQILKINAQPLVDRTALIALDAPRFMSDFVGDMLKPSVTRGLSELMTADAHEMFEHYRAKTDARAAWNFAVIHTLLRWVRESEPSEDDVKAVYLML
jgi:DNA polymerase III delta prime subunit